MTDEYRKGYAAGIMAAAKVVQDRSTPRPRHRVLRFSESEVPGRYRWASVETDSIEVVRHLVDLWNGDAAIAIRKLLGEPEWIDPPRLD